MRFCFVAFDAAGSDGLDTCLMQSLSTYSTYLQVVHPVRVFGVLFLVVFMVIGDLCPVQLR